MEYYKNEIAEVLADKVAEGYETKEEILKRREELKGLLGAGLCGLALALPFVIYILLAN